LLLLLLLLLLLWFVHWLYMLNWLWNIIFLGWILKCWKQRCRNWSIWRKIWITWRDC